MSNYMRRIASVLIILIMMNNTVISQLVFADESRDAGGKDVATVRVYFSISNDSEFLVGNDDDSRIMARVPIDVPYVDLAEYGLEEFYRYEAKPYEEGGEYSSTVVVERPTLLMCFLKGLSQYYLGREITAADISHSTQYSGEGQSKTLTTNGSATSLYLLWFWGHFYNFMYFVNHEYPLMAEGWGATADYILLEDGDEIDVGMFSDTRFNVYGGFAYFDSGNMTITAGDSVDMSLYLTKSQYSGGSDYNEPMNKEPIRISSDYGKTWQSKVFTTDKQGMFTASFNEAGVYYVSAGPVFKNQPYAQLQCITPPICVVEVKPSPVENCIYEQVTSGVQVSWDASPGATGYEMRYVDNEGQNKTIETTAPDVVITDADTEECSFEVRPYVTDEYVAMGEENKTLYGSPVSAVDMSFKGRYAEEISSYPDYSLYREAEQEEIHGIVDKAVTDIEECSAQSDAAQIVTDAKAAIDQIKTNAEYEAEDAQAALDEAKSAAITELESYKDSSLYRDAEKEELSQVVMEEKARINNAKTVSEVSTILFAAKIRIDLIKTAAQYEQEEQEQQEQAAKELAEAKTWAKSELLKYMNEKDLSLYRDNEKALLAEKLQEGIALIDAAEDQVGVSEALANAKLSLDSVKTDAELTQEELEEAKTNACLELAAYKDPALYRDAEKEILLSIISEEQEKISSAETKEKVAEIVAEAKSRLDEVKTDAELTEEEEQAKELQEAKDNALSELTEYRAPSDYREAEKALLLEIENEVRDLINNAGTSDEIAEILADAKARIDGLKTDAEYTAEEKQQEEEQRAAEEKRKAEILAAKIKAARAAKAKVTVKALKKHKAKISWKKVTLSYKAAGETGKFNVTGYKIYRATKKNGKYKVIKTIKKAGTLKYTDRKLKRGRKYYYKVRTYTKIGSKTYLGKWSKVKKITAK